eukprot:492638_1
MFFVVGCIIIFIDLINVSDCNNICNVSQSPPLPEINTFMNIINGNVYNISNEEYHNITSSVDNQRNTFYPLLIVLPINSNDIIETIKFTKYWCLKFSILGGGHNAVGWALNNNGIVLDMQYFNNIQITQYNETIPSISIDAGVKWYQVYRYMKNSSKYNISIVLGGVCPTVGVIGFTLGGGLNLVSKSYGLSIDNVLSLTLITVQHPIREITVSNNNHLSLLHWSILGGGGNNFGVVTNIITKLHEPNNKINHKLLYTTIEYVIYDTDYEINNIENITNILLFYNNFQFYNLTDYIQ